MSQWADRSVGGLVHGSVGGLVHGSVGESIVLLLIAFNVPMTIQAQRRAATATIA